jgi:RNA-directed DNA polymerase
MELTIHNVMVRRKQEQLYYRAVQEPELKFTALYGLLLWEHWGEEALRRVLSNRGARTPGVDGMTKEDLTSRQAQVELLDELKAELAVGNYHHQPVLRRYIPKGRGKLRPLGIPTIRDRVVQAMVKELLEPIFEADFEDCSYGFRPNRGCWDALAEIGQYLKRPSDYEWIVEGDIRDCFGSMDHKILMKQLRRRISDSRLLSLIWQMLRAGVLEDLEYYSTDIGSPQGGLVSPLLANVYMHQLDEWAAAHSHQLTESQKRHRRKRGSATIRLTRYADDFVVMVKGTRAQTEEIKAEIADYVRSKMRMELSLEKTHITHRTEGFVFLGIQIRYGESRNRRDKEGKGRENVYYLPAPKAISRYKAKVRELTSPATYPFKDVEVIRALNRFILGWGNYYRHANSRSTFNKLENWTWHRVFRWLQRRHRMSLKAAHRSFRVAKDVPVNKHPTRNDRRLGAWDGKGHFLALWPLSFIPIRYWKYRGSRIPQKCKAEANGRSHPEPPGYDTIVWSEGKDPRRTAEYRNLREIVKAGARYHCQQCGRYASGNCGGHVHHRDGNPAHNDLDNLEFLCAQCHRETESYGKHKK